MVHDLAEARAGALLDLERLLELLGGDEPALQKHLAEQAAARGMHDVQGVVVDRLLGGPVGLVPQLLRAGLHLGLDPKRVAHAAEDAVDRRLDVVRRGDHEPQVVAGELGDHLAHELVGRVTAGDRQRLPRQRDREHAELARDLRRHASARPAG